jgi:hypothetical protein
MVRTPNIKIANQITVMKRYFPQFAYYRSKNIPTWKGILQPTDASPPYLIRVSYREPKPPRVSVLAPKLHDQAPHRYLDGTLCLYYPRDRSWTPRMFIAETIIPWTALWLRFYELWLQTNTWYRPEAPHGRTKRG